MHRFFADPSFISGGEIILSGDDLKHIRALRLGRDEKFVVCDGQGTDFFCVLLSLEKDRAVCGIAGHSKNCAEPDIKATLFQGMPKADKMELIIQKCVELGVYEIVPVITGNAVAKPSDNAASKSARYGKISEAAAKQSGRGIIPKVSEPIGFLAAAERLSQMDEAYMAYEKENVRTLGDTFARCSAGSTVGFFVGPEGGFTDAEARVCEQNKINTVTLGKRILRTETAGFVLLTAYFFSRGRL